MKINTDHHWQVGLYGVKVGSKTYKKQAKNIFFDTGASLNFVPTKLFKSIVSHIEEQKGEKCTPAENDNDMLVCPCTGIHDRAFPNIKIQMGESKDVNKWFTYHSRYYLSEDRAGGKC